MELQDRPLASPDQLRNLRTWLECYPNAVEALEQEFLSSPGDLICHKLARRTKFGRYMQSLGASTMASVSHGPNHATMFYDRNVWKSLGGSWLLLCTIAMLLGPLWAMPFARSTLFRLVVVTSATVGFSVLTIVGTTLKASHRSLLVAGYV